MIGFKNETFSLSLTFLPLPKRPSRVLFVSQGNRSESSKSPFILLGKKPFQSLPNKEMKNPDVCVCV